MDARHFVAIATFAGVTLFSQVALTRLFSVVQYYHGAFLALSLALFGFSASGVFVFLRPALFPRERLDAQLGFCAALLALSIPACFGFYLYFGVEPLLGLLGFEPGRTTWVVGLEYVILALPFFASGLGISLLLFHGASQANRLYAADLCASALGAVLVIPSLAALGGPKTMLVASVVAAAGALPFLRAAAPASLLAPAVAAGALLTLLVVPVSTLNTFRLRKPPLVVAGEPIFWNSFSMVGVQQAAPPGRTRPAVVIDNSVTTELVGADEDLAWARLDWSAAVHALRPGSSVLIIGSGGGRDIQVARAFGQEPIWAVEVNPLVVKVANDVFGDFTGHVYSQPGVRPVVGDARSYVANSKERYDVILASLIDTWAASAAGAFALTENLLYTTDAFRDYYDHLSDDGFLSISRWHPLETPRLLATGFAAWQEAGVAEPRRHAAMIFSGQQFLSDGIVVLIMKKSPLTSEEIATLERFCETTGHTCALTPDTIRHPLIEKILVNQAGGPLPPAWAGLDIAPVSDERPFFFNVIRPSTQLADMLGLVELNPPRGFVANLQATKILIQLLGAVTVLIALTIGLPLLSRLESLRGGSRARTLGYFACLGLGYILIEVGLVQRVILLLGKPVYSLSLILSGMLLSSGLGSFVSGIPSKEFVRRNLPSLLALTAILLAVESLFLPGWIRALLGTPFAVRVAASLLVVSVPAFLMGMAFPSAIRLLEARGAGGLVPWAWGVNGATSVLGSVGAIILAIEVGYGSVFGLGTACYLVAALLLAGWPELSARSATSG